MSKIISKNNINKILKKFKKEKKKVGLCHGVFDLIHIGHLTHFKEAKKYCDKLIVSVTEDKFINKGPGRPVFDLNNRMTMLSNLELVDFVISSNEDSSVSVIKKIKPNFYFKGPDYKDFEKDLSKKIIFEKKTVKKFSGKLIITKAKKYSSTNLINSSTSFFSDDIKNYISIIKKKFTINQIFSSINSLKKICPTVIGETIIDQYFFCESRGKSGKEPTLVMSELHNEKYLGGAAAICNHLASFCEKIIFLSSIGSRNSYLKFIKRKMNDKVKSNLIIKRNSDTIIKKRFIDKYSKSKVLGIYNVEERLLTNIEESKILKKLNSYNYKNKLSIISDYGHGLLTKKIIESLRKNFKFVSVNSQLNAFNIGYQNLEKYQKVNLVIINEAELRHEMRSKDEDLKNLIVKLSKKIKPKYLTVTRGASGVILYDIQNKKFYKCAAFEKNPVDKIGAGDALLGILSICLYKKIDIHLSLLISSLCAAQSIKYMGHEQNVNKTKLINDLKHFLA